jgi:ribose-phosphate pyrophosphokinase
MSTAILNLTDGFEPYFETSLPEFNYDSFIFNGGEVHFKLDLHNMGYPAYDKVIITSRASCSDDIMRILIAKDALERTGVKSFELIMPYIPYARQDRVCDEGESFSLKVFANIINSAEFDKVITLDAHSLVAPALLNNCVDGSNESYILNSGHATWRILQDETKELLLISPDMGANKKSEKLMRDSDFKEMIQCDKTRDPKTGKLTGFKVLADDLGGLPCLIADDVCDGGGTFMGLAVELKKKNAGNLYLFVTHGIFSNGFDELKKHFKLIFCTDSFSDLSDNDNVIQYKVEIYNI